MAESGPGSMRGLIQVNGLSEHVPHSHANPAGSCPFLSVLTWVPRYTIPFTKLPISSVSSPLCNAWPSRHGPADMALRNIDDTEPPYSAAAPSTVTQLLTRTNATVRMTPLAIKSLERLWRALTRRGEERRGEDICQMPGLRV